MLLSRQSRKEYYHSLVKKTEKKNTDRKQKPAEPVNVNRDKLSDTDQLTWTLSGWKNSSGCDTTTQKGNYGEEKMKGEFSRKH